MRVFVIWDLTTPTLRTFLEALPEIVPVWEGEPIDWHIPTIRTSGREVARDLLLGGLQQCDHCIALLDGPSPGVGFQLGLALGLRKSLRLASLQPAAPAWTHSSALKGLGVQHLDDVASMRALLRPLSWDLPDARPPAHARQRLIVCPDGPVGSSLRAIALRDRGSQALPPDGWGLYELPLLLAGCSEVVWILAPDANQGGDNAAGGVIAGLAEALGLRVFVLRAADVPAGIDLQTRERTFTDLAAFKRKLGQLDAASAQNRDAEQAVPTPPALASWRRVVSPRQSVPLAILLLCCGVGLVRLLRWPAAPGPATTESSGPIKNQAATGQVDASPAARVDLGPAVGTAPHHLHAMTRPLPSPQDRTGPPRKAHTPAQPTCALSSAQLADLVFGIQDAVFPDRGWRIYEQRTHDRCLTVDQLIRILDLFGWSEYKIRVMKLAAPRIRDRQNVHRLKNILTARVELQAVDALFPADQIGKH